MARYLIILLLVAVVVVAGCARDYVESDVIPLNQASGECSADSDCTYMFNSCPTGPELCAPRWGAFCVNGSCELSHDHSKDESAQWIETCAEHKVRGVDNMTLERCYTQAAYTALKKSDDTGNYTIIWSDAFLICDTYLPSAAQGCRLDICSNLALGDGNLKGDYPEADVCEAQAKK